MFCLNIKDKVAFLFLSNNLSSALTCNYKRNAETLFIDFFVSFNFPRLVRRHHLSRQLRKVVSVRQGLLSVLIN